MSLDEDIEKGDLAILLTLFSELDSRMHLIEALNPRINRAFPCVGITTAETLSGWGVTDGTPYVIYVALNEARGYDSFFFSNFYCTI